MPKILIKEVEVYYESHGEGMPLVLIPGFASGAWSWSWQIPELSSFFNVITFDPRGVANSAVNAAQVVSIDTIAEDVSELLAALELEKAYILGISFGGFVAQEFALKYPERVSKLVLASTSFGGPRHVTPSMEVLAAFASVDGLNSPDRIRRYLTLAFSPTFLASDPDAVDRFCRLREQNQVPENVYLQQLHSALAFNTEARVSTIAAESLVITGDCDSVVPMQNSQNLTKLLSNSRIEIIEGAGHMAFVERSEEFNRLVSDFLRE